MEERKFWMVVGLTLLAGFLLKAAWFFRPFHFATPVIPGLHTTFYPPVFWVRFGLFFSVCAALVCFIFLWYKRYRK